MLRSRPEYGLDCLICVKFKIRGCAASPSGDWAPSSSSENPPSQVFSSRGFHSFLVACPLILISCFESFYSAFCSRVRLSNPQFCLVSFSSELPRTLKLPTPLRLRPKPKTRDPKPESLCRPRCLHLRGRIPDPSTRTPKCES